MNTKLRGTTRTGTEPHGIEEDKQRGLSVGEIKQHDVEKVTVEDELVERLEACGHMLVTDGVTAVTNDYPDEPGKDSRTSLVQHLRVSLGQNGTKRVLSCTCEDYMYRQLPTNPDDEPDPFDVLPEQLADVLHEITHCKHIKAMLLAAIERTLETDERHPATRKTTAATTRSIPSYEPKSYYSDDRNDALEPGAYGWTVEEATRAAFADSPAADPVVGSPRGRWLTYHSDWTGPATAKRAVEHIGQYNRFDPAEIRQVLGSLPDGTMVSVGREGSPVIYLWTTEPVDVIGQLEAMDGSPDELGGKPEADVFPEGIGVGAQADALENGTPTLLRAWWD